MIPAFEIMPGDPVIVHLDDGDIEGVASTTPYGRPGEEPVIGIRRLGADRSQSWPISRVRLACREDQS